MKYNTAMKYNGWIQTIRDLKNEKFELIDSENNTDLVETVKNTISIIKTNNELLDKCVYAGLNLNNITIVEVEINKLFIHLFGESETAKLYNVNSLEDLFNSMFALMEVLRVLEELINIRLRSEGIETDKTAIRNVSDSEKLENIQYDINWNIADNKLHTDFKIIPNLIEVQLQHVKNLDKYVKKKPETDFDCSDTTNPLIYEESMFDNLPASNLPVIDRDIIKPEFIIEKYLNKAFECSPFAFYAWLVYGKKYEKEQINWTFKKDNSDTVSKAQLKLFINKITNTDTAKKSYFNQVFGMKIEKSDYRNSFSLDVYFKELTDEIDRNKLNIK